MTINVNCPPRGLFIGRETENVARALTVDFSAWAAEYSTGTLQILFQRPGTESPYAVVLTRDGTTATWKPSETDLAEAGTGAVQIIYTVGDVRVKTSIIPVMVEPSLGVETDPPEGWTSWIDQLTDLAAVTEQHAASAAESAENAGDSATDAQRYATDAGDAKNAAVAAAEAAAVSASHYPQIVNGVWYVWSPSAGAYISTGIDAQGEDGVSPTVEITAIQGGHRVVITDAEGSHTFDVMDGVTPDLSAYRTAADQDEIDDAQDEELNNLKSAINQIATFETGQDEIIYHKADLQTTYDSTYVNEGSISDTGRFSASASYRTYYLEVTEAMDVWIENSASGTQYLSLAVYNNNVSPSSFVGRYRNNDNNLPDENNRLTLTSGQWIAVTLGYSSQGDRDFDLYTGLYTPASADPVPTEAFMTAINERIDVSVGKVTKTTTSLTVNMGKLKYEVNKYSNSTIRAYLWRTNACRVLDDNETYQTIWSDSDSDGVVKIRGEGDFIGGYHGDETETLFKLFVDGVEYAEDSTFTDLDFNEIVLYFESDVYHCNTSATPNTVAFKRNKIIKFNDEGYTVCNYWTAQENLTCEISYIGMLSVENGLINAYSTNADFKYHALDSGAANSPDMTDVCFNTPYGDIGIKVFDPIPNEHYSCGVTAYTGRLKAYAANFRSSAHGVLSAGDVLKGKAVTYFRS